MTMPLALLAWSGFLGLLHAASTGAVRTSQYGQSYGTSPRDEEPPPLTTRRARNVRAFENFMQTFPIFAAGVVVSSFGREDHGVAAWGAQFYFWGRLLYVPAYITGSRFRTPIWLFSVLGILLVYLSVA